MKVLLVGRSEPDPWKGLGSTAEGRARQVERLLGSVDAAVYLLDYTKLKTVEEASLFTKLKARPDPHLKPKPNPARGLLAAAAHARARCRQRRRARWQTVGRLVLHPELGKHCTCAGSYMVRRQLSTIASLSAACRADTTSMEWTRLGDHTLVLDLMATRAGAQAVNPALVQRLSTRLFFVVNKARPGCAYRHREQGTPNRRMDRAPWEARNSRWRWRWRAWKVPPTTKPLLPRGASIVFSRLSRGTAKRWRLQCAPSSLKR